MLVLGEAELRKNQKPFLSGEVEVEVEVDVLELERRFLPLGGFSGAGSVFFFHLGRRRALIHEKTRPRITLYEQGLIFVRFFFGQSYFDLLL